MTPKTKVLKILDKYRDKENSNEAVAEFKIAHKITVKVTEHTLPKVYGSLWHLNTKGYAYRMKDKKCVFMHREVLGFEIPDGWQIDHINRDTLDNRLSNLRAVRPQQNTMNRKATGGDSSYKGVWQKKDFNRTKPWAAHIKIDQKTRHIGNYSTEKEAALAYDKRAKFFFGEYALLNFPEDKNPATPLTLLKALEAGEGHAILDSGGTMVVFENEYDDQPVQIQIPNVTTLTEVPEEHKMWQAVLDVLI